MRIIRKSFSFILALAIFTVFSASAFAENTDPTEVIVPYHIESSVFNENNEVVGTKVVDTVIEVKDVDKGTLKTITENIQYNLIEEAHNLRHIYKDEILTTEILIETSGDYYVNGVQLTDEYLNTLSFGNLIN